MTLRIGLVLKNKVIQNLGVSKSESSKSILQTQLIGVIKLFTENLHGLLIIK